MKAPAEAPVTESVPKVRAPAELPLRLTPSIPFVIVVFPNEMFPVVVDTDIPCVPALVTLVVPKFAVRLEPVILMPSLPVFEIAVVPETVKEPEMVVSVRPAAAAALVEVMLANVAASAPLVKLSAAPVPLKVISLIVRVPKLAPEAILDPVVLPIVKPRRVLLLPTPMLMPLVAAAAVVITGGALPVVGKGSLPGGTLTPAIVASDALAPSPINF